MIIGQHLIFTRKNKIDLTKLQQPTLESTARAKLVVLLVFLPSFFVLANLANERVKGIIDSHSGLGGRFDKWHPVLLRHLKNNTIRSIILTRKHNKTHISRLVHIDGPCLEITFIANENHRDFFGILDALNLLSIRS